jgi:predicted phosphohydrolase
MLNIQIYSDIHIELYNSYPKIPPLCDYLFLAGDIGIINTEIYKNFFIYCSKNWKKVFYILGNHEYWKKNQHFIKTEQKYEEYFKNNFDNIFLLNNSFVTLDNIDIYGCTLWTNPNINENSNLNEYINDYKNIKIYSKEKNKRIVLNYDFIEKISIYQFNKLKEFLNIQSNNKQIILTHFSPIYNEFTCNPKYINEIKIIKDYYHWDNIFNNLNISDNNNILCWISGHTHYSFDFYYKNIRILSNQMGNITENTNFNSNGLFELTNIINK